MSSAAAPKAAPLDEPRAAPEGELILGQQQQQQQQSADSPASEAQKRAAGEGGLKGASETRGAGLHTKPPASQRREAQEQAARQANTNNNNSASSSSSTRRRPLILITDSNSPGSSSPPAERAAQVEGGAGRRRAPTELSGHAHQMQAASNKVAKSSGGGGGEEQGGVAGPGSNSRSGSEENFDEREEQVEEVDGIRYRIVAAVTKPPAQPLRAASGGKQQPLPRPLARLSSAGAPQRKASQAGAPLARLSSSMRRKSSALVANLLHSSFTGPQSASSSDLSGKLRPRRLSIYEMTKSPPPETSLEIYLSERRRSSTISSEQVARQLEQQSTFETNYCQRQQYFKDLNQKLINHDKKLLNVVANRGLMQRHSVDIAQLPLNSAVALANQAALAAGQAAKSAKRRRAAANTQRQQERLRARLQLAASAEPEPAAAAAGAKSNQPEEEAPIINQWAGEWPAAAKAESDLEQAERDDDDDDQDELLDEEERAEQLAELGKATQRLMAIRKNRSLLDRRGSVASRGERQSRKTRIVIRKFQKLDQSQLTSTPAPDVKIGQRVAYKEYYGNEFGTIRWIGRVPQICADWTVGVEFDNAIGEGDGSLNGRRYFIAKDCFAKFIPLSNVALVDQHVGRPEPGTMISVMSAAVRPGQMISIQRVSTVHVQHCFLNAPHRKPGADILAVNTRLHCQCPNCGPCAHVIKPPRTQRLARAGKNATHMCQFSTYTCCGMESQEETMCTYTGNKVSALPPPYHGSSSTGLPPLGNSWFEGAGYLSNLQAQQSKAMPEEYRTIGAAPEEVINPDAMLRRLSRSSSSRRGSGRRKNKPREQANGFSSPPPNGPTSADLQQQQQQQHQPMQYETDVAGNNNMQYFESNTYSHYQQQQADYSQQQLALATAAACPDKDTPNIDNYYSNNISSSKCCEQEQSDQVCSKDVPRSAKVVYRNSIENRYLFPTDEPIDSTLEADLENLSQARYGKGTYSRLSGSRNILKSLRSLVSCLSARSNHSELDRQSENTLSFSQRVTKVTNNNNKCMPEVTWSTSPEEQPQKDLCVHFKTKSEKEKDDDDDDLEFKYANSHVLSSKVSPPEDQQMNGKGTFTTKTTTTTTTTADHQAIRRHISSSSDCGFSSASQNSINFPFPASSPVLTIEDELRTKQIYKRIVARLLNSTSVTNDELNRLRKVLFEPSHLENCCLHNNALNSLATTAHLNSTFNQAESDQLIADIIHRSHLKNEKNPISTSQLLAEQRPASCCLHAPTNCYSNTFEWEQQCYEQSQKMKSYENELSCRQVNGNQKQDTLPPSSKPLSKCATDEYNSQDNRSHHTKSTTGSLTPSSYDSFLGTAIIGEENSLDGSRGDEIKRKDEASAKLERSQQEIGQLPKAFELKLTLSINSDNSKQSFITNPQTKQSALEASFLRTEGQIAQEETKSGGNLMNSTLNIDIKSASTTTADTTSNAAAAAAEVNISLLEKDSEETNAHLEAADEIGGSNNPDDQAG